MTKNFNLIFRGKSYHGLPWTGRDAAVHQGLNNIRELTSKLNGVKFEKLTGDYQLFDILPWGELIYNLLGR